MTSILAGLAGPSDLRGLNLLQLNLLAREIRDEIVSTVAMTGGHLGSSLGAVEVAIALHRLLESPRDRIIWDTGHQAYAHKLLTGRLADFRTLRQIDGIGGFPRRVESPHDVFDGGHAGTGLSIASGFATARDIRHGLERVAVVVGDAALMTGLSLEALNDIGQRGTRMLIVLNDNEMSISPTVGAFSNYLSQIKLTHAWQTSRLAWDRLVKRIPVIGPEVLEWSRRVRRSVANFASPGQLFEDLGIRYIGPVDGHDLRALLRTFRRAFELSGPVIVHVRTQKGHGYEPAELDRVSFHGAALPPMEVSAANGGSKTARLLLPEAVIKESPSVAPVVASTRPKPANYSSALVSELIALARVDSRIVAITAGMPTGTGLARFQREFPDRFFDVGIAEQHAVTLATGLALAGLRPVVAIYSTFLQRAFDEIVHDVCQNDVPVLIAVDRAGLVGEDGTSHQGMFMIPAQRQLPNLVVASPKDEQELRSLVRSAFAQDHPFALHYPRDAGLGLPAVEPVVIPVGRAEVLREGSDLLFIGFGPIVMRAVDVADTLRDAGWSIAVLNGRFAQPIDRSAIAAMAHGKRLVVTFEESVVSGGFGSAVLEALEEARLADPALRATALRIIGIPAGRFVDHGAVGDLRHRLRLDVAGLGKQVREAIDTLGLEPTVLDTPVGAAGRAAP
ncbi:MAG TPA: 1-deoxy-D-xylulose-5-phosphate synthase [Candidatus Eisenbacteria bacterium]|nr:1-deoxy-D-xylulose-5-phosphate synthase [Candidatus Eisenbacteria bacterium]